MENHNRVKEDEKSRPLFLKSGIWIVGEWDLGTVCYWLIGAWIFLDSVSQNQRNIPCGLYNVLARKN